MKRKAAAAVASAALDRPTKRGRKSGGGGLGSLGKKAISGVGKLVEASGVKDLLTLQNALMLGSSITAAAATGGASAAAQAAAAGGSALLGNHVKNKIKGLGQVAGSKAAKMVSALENADLSKMTMPKLSGLGAGRDHAPISKMLTPGLRSSALHGGVQHGLEALGMEKASRKVKEASALGSFLKTMVTQAPEIVMHGAAGKGFHYPGSNYIGPGTNVGAAGAPTSGTDALARTHDIHYEYLQKQGVNPYFTSNEADRQMLSGADLSTPEGWGNFIFIGLKEKLFPKNRVPVPPVPEFGKDEEQVKQIMAGQYPGMKSVDPTAAAASIAGMEAVGGGGETLSPSSLEHIQPLSDTEIHQRMLQMAAQDPKSMSPHVNGLLYGWDNPASQGSLTGASKRLARDTFLASSGAAALQGTHPSFPIPQSSVPQNQGGASAVSMGTGSV
jgi:hypothetical protein